MDISTKVWDINNTDLKTLRKVVMTAIEEGKSQSQITNLIRPFLILPDADMRKTFWKDFFKMFPSGRGVYRSAWKNIMRLTRTETNRAFRQYSAEYAKTRKWVYGIKWFRSPASEPCVECDGYANDDTYGLGAGIYPPDGLPVSHPFCICYTILVPRENAVDDALKDELKDIIK